MKDSNRISGKKWSAGAHLIVMYLFFFVSMDCDCIDTCNIHQASETVYILISVLIIALVTARDVNALTASKLI